MRHPDVIVSPDDPEEDRIQGSHWNKTHVIPELSADLDDPDDGFSVIWQSDGTGSGDAGDILMKTTSGGVTKTINLTDYSTGSVPGGGGGGVAEDRIGFSVVSVNNITPGIKAYRTVPFDSIIVGWFIDSNTAGDIQVDVQKDLATPVSIVGAGTKPILSASASNSDVSPDWDTLSLTEGDILVFEVEAGATIKQVVLTLDLLST